MRPISSRLWASSPAAPALQPPVRQVPSRRPSRPSWRGSRRHPTPMLAVMHLEPIPQQQTAAVPRLAAALSLKACIGRKWKDRGRGGLGHCLGEAMGKMDNSNRNSNLLRQHSYRMPPRMQCASRYYRWWWEHPFTLQPMDNNCTCRLCHLPLPHFFRVIPAFSRHVLPSSLALDALICP